MPPLSLPDEAGVAAGVFDEAALVRSEAVQLFLARAREAQPSFRSTRQISPAITQVCRRLDGLPLAIELAAARARVLSVEEIAARLDDRFRFLTGGGRVALPRQRTLRATIDWSHDLLSEPERALLRRLAVFVGGWTEDAAEAVGIGEDVGAGEVLELLAQLVDKSLVEADTRGTRRASVCWKPSGSTRERASTPAEKSMRPGIGMRSSSSPSRTRRSRG